MGNTNTRYLTNAETVDILGGVERWNALKLTFEKIAGKSMDFRLFCNIIQRRFQNIVSCYSSYHVTSVLYSLYLNPSLFLSYVAESTVRDAFPSLCC